MKHIQGIRISTKLPVFLPSRFLSDPHLLQLFSTFSQRFAITLQCHFTHPLELTDDCLEAISRLRQSGCLLGSQIALLKSVNDSPDTLASLFKKLQRIGVTAQYLFHPRPVQHATHFQMAISDGLDIVSAVRKKLAGPEKRFRYILVNEDGKIELVGKTGDQQRLVIRWHQSRQGLNREDELREISLTPELSWLDQETL